MKNFILAAFGASAALVNAAAINPTLVQRANTTDCYTVKTGYLTVFISEAEHTPVGLNTQQQVTYGTNDPHFAVEFQACPATGTQRPDLEDYTGQIKVTGSDNCVTVSNPTGPEGGPFFLQTATCLSTTLPPASQRWEYGNDFGAVVFWMGASTNDEVGYTVPDDGNTPQTEAGTGRIELGCASSCASFNITPL